MKFYNRILHCHFIVDLKIDRYRHEYASQLNTYKNYYRHEVMQPGDNPPIGLLLCSEGNTEHIELMMLNEDHIKVSQYLTCLPDKQWFIDKLNRSILIAKEYSDNH